MHTYMHTYKIECERQSVIGVYLGSWIWKPMTDNIIAANLGIMGHKQRWGAGDRGEELGPTIPFKGKPPKTSHAPLGPTCQDLQLSALAPIPTRVASGRHAGARFSTGDGKSFICSCARIPLQLRNLRKKNYPNREENVDQIRKDNRCAVHMALTSAHFSFLAVAFSDDCLVS